MFMILWTLTQAEIGNQEQLTLRFILQFKEMNILVKDTKFDFYHTNKGKKSKNLKLMQKI